MSSLDVLIKSELRTLHREAMQAPLPEQRVSAEQEIIVSEYGPFGAFDKAVAVYLKHFLLPLIQRMIDRVSDLQLEHRTRYGALASVFQRYFESFVLEGWTNAINNAYRIATSHVIEKTGKLQDYKREELIEYLKKQGEIPIGLVEDVKDRLAKAMGKTNLAISRRKENMDSQKIQTVLGFLFGVIFVSAILVIALFVPFPSDFQYQVFRIVLALAAGGVGAVIPGILNVNIPKLVTAGGALAVFVVVYFYSPAQLAVKQLPPQERLLELIYIGHNTKFGQWVQGHRYVGETGPAQKYLRDCADFLDEIKHPAAGQVHLWATQGDICTLADATNSTVSQILEPLAKGKTVAEPTLEHSHEGGCP